ncbi:MAG: hypothetical protein K2L02_01635 [Clostridia bacterium]|nr:hypothetical protein [Clostridia bacterium]
MKKRIFAALLVASVACMAFAGCKDTEQPPKNPTDPSGSDPVETFTPKPVDGTPILFDEGMEYYNTAPSMIEESDSLRYIVYSVNKTANQKDTVFAARKAEKKSGVWEYGEKHVILEPSASGWDKGHIANPDVIKGAFSYNGESYSYLLAYQASDSAAQSNYNIGLAVAKDPLGSWVKVGNAPVIEYDSDGYGAGYGVGEPSLMSYDDEGKVYLFHSMGDTYSTGVYVAELDCSDLSNIRGASVSNAVTTHGMTDPGQAVVSYCDADFALDKTTGTLYTVRNFMPMATVKPFLPLAVQVLKMPFADLYKIGAEWEVVETRINDTDLSTEENDGWERVYSACFITDAYGKVTGSALDMALSVTSYNKTSFEHTFYQTITSYIVNVED